MLRLYRQIGNELHYWETWEADEKTGIIHWGLAGEPGQHKEIKSGIFSVAGKIIGKAIDQKIREGYAELNEDN